jgi:hypothetical protein
VSRDPTLERHPAGAEHIPLMEQPTAGFDVRGLAYLRASPRILNWRGHARPVAKACHFRAIAADFRLDGRMSSSISAGLCRSVPALVAEGSERSTKAP